MLGSCPEVVEGLGLVGKNVARWDEDVVGVDALAGVRHPEGVVEGCRGFVVGEAVEVPIGLFVSVLIYILSILLNGK